MNGFVDLESFVKLAGIYALVAAGLMLVYFGLFKRAALNYYDPILFNGVVFLAPYTAGFLVFPAVDGGISSSYWIIIGYLIALLAIVSWVGRPRSGGFRCEMSDGFLRTLLLMLLSINVLNFLINMLAGGTIPLFSEAGAAGRFESTTNSRLLTWLFLATQGYAATIYAVSESTPIRRLALWCFGFEMISGLLFASKGAILQPIFLLLSSAFVASCRNDRAATERYFRLLKRGLLALLLVAPGYLSFVLKNDDSGTTAMRLGIRLLGGFDQLIPAALYDMASSSEPNPEIGLNLMQYQLLPFFKILQHLQPVYSSVGQYVVEYWTGRPIEGPFTFPNSNLILETIFTSGVVLGFVFYCVQLLAFYIARFRTLNKPIDAISLILMKTIVYSPFGLFLSGQEFVSNLIVVSCVTFAAFALWKLVGEPPAKRSAEEKFPLAMDGTAPNR